MHLDAGKVMQDVGETNQFSQASMSGVTVFLLFHYRNHHVAWSGFCHDFSFLKFFILTEFSKLLFVFLSVYIDIDMLENQ